VTAAGEEARAARGPSVRPRTLPLDADVNLVVLWATWCPPCRDKGWRCPAPPAPTGREVDGLEEALAEARRSRTAGG